MRWGSAGSASRAGAMVVLASAVLLAACGGLDAVSGPASNHIVIPGASSASGSGTSVSPPPDPARAASGRRAVISAWMAAQLAFENAVRTADPTAPELYATTVEPQLTWAESFLTLVRAAREGATGPVAFGDPQVVMEGPDLATVRACVHDGETVVSAATGLPVPGVLGQVDVEAFTSIMEHTVSGWKLANQDVVVGQCGH